MGPSDQLLPLSAPFMLGNSEGGAGKEGEEQVLSAPLPEAARVTGMWGISTFSVDMNHFNWGMLTTPSLPDSETVAISM